MHETDSAERYPVLRKQEANRNKNSEIANPKGDPK
jgi:hypothetical protein